MVEDMQTWKEARARIITKITYTDFQILCQLHAKYYKHKYIEICGHCNKVKLRNWISDVDDKLI